MAAWYNTELLVHGSFRQDSSTVKPNHGPAAADGVNLCSRSNTTAVMNGGMGDITPESLTMDSRTEGQTPTSRR